MKCHPTPARALLCALFSLPCIVLASEDHITFDLASAGTPVDHKGSGMLCGIERGTPDDSMLTPLKLHGVRLSQATELPEENPFDLYTRANGLGVQDVVLIVSDAVKCTNPTLNDPTNWENYWVSQVTSLATQAAAQGKTFVWDIYNEPDKKIGATATSGTPCGTPSTTPIMPMASNSDWYNVWDEAYNAIRSALPSAQITGPSYSTYNQAAIEAFIDHCASANTMPDIINWHFGTISSYSTEANTIRAYAAGKGYTVSIMIGEAIASGTDLNLDPGEAVTLFANAERANIRTLHASWTATPVAGIQQAFFPHLDGLLTPDTLLPRGAWWSYESYGEMSGVTLTADLTSSPDLDGLASLDVSAHRAIALVGTTNKSSYTSGAGKVKFTDVVSTTGLVDGNGYVHVKVERIPLTENELTVPQLESEGDFKPSSGGSLEVPFTVSTSRESAKVTLSLPTVPSPSRPSNLIEGETLPVTVSSGRSVTNLSDSGASAGLFSKAALTTVGDWVQYTFTAPAAATYQINIGYKADPSRGILAASVDSTALGASLDQSTSYAGYPDVGLGSLALSAGTHTLTLTVQGKSSTSTGYTAALDYLRLTPLTPIEAESLTPTLSPGDTYSTNSDSAASGGKLSIYNLNAIGDYVDLSINVPEPGLYEVLSTLKTFTSRGIYQLSIDGVPLGAPVDGYSSRAAYATFSQGITTIATAGMHDFRMTVVGQNPSSTGETIGLDCLTLTPTSLDTITLGTQASPTASSGATLSTASYSNARGGAYSKVDLYSLGDKAHYTFSVPETGFYFLSMRYASGPDGGQFQMDVDGTSLYSAIDTDNYQVAITELGIGSLQLSQGTHTLTFTAVGQSGCSTGLTIGVDAIRASRLDPATPSVAVRKSEAESASPSVTSGSYSIVANSAASGGAYVAAFPTNLGDSVSFQFSSLPGGVYRLETGFRSAPGQARFTAVHDTYSIGKLSNGLNNPTELFRGANDPDTDFGSFILSGPESPVFTYKEETNAGGSEIDIDYLSLVKYTRDR